MLFTFVLDNYQDLLDSDQRANSIPFSPEADSIASNFINVFFFFWQTFSNLTIAGIADLRNRIYQWAVFMIAKRRSFAEQGNIIVIMLQHGLRRAGENNFRVGTISSNHKIYWAHNMESSEIPFLIIHVKKDKHDTFW